MRLPLSLIPVEDMSCFRKLDQTPTISIFGEILAPSAHDRPLKSSIQMTRPGENNR
jgi:hypothetical protein